MKKEYIIFALVLLHIIAGFGFLFYKIFKKPGDKNQNPKD
jgi:hypothetical protein